MNIRLIPGTRLLRRASHAVWIIATVATAAIPRVAWAHAHLVKSAPAAGSHVLVSPTAIQLWYSEAADAALTTVSIVGPGGAHMLAGKLVAAAANPLLLSTTLASPLPPGRYTVNWHAVAKDDGHPSQGSFVFTVDSATPGAAGQVANNDSMSRSDTVPTAHAPVTVETSSIQWTDVEAPGYIVARWLTFAGLISVLGVVGFVLLVLPRVAPQNDAAQMSNFKVNARRRATTLGLVAALVIIASAVWRLYAELGVVGGDVTVGTLIQTFWGHVWLAQIVLAALLCLTFLHARGERLGKSVSPAWPVTVIAALLLSATPAFSGHAAAAVSHRVLSIGLDIVHVLAAGGWLGGLFVLAAAGVPAALATRADTETSERLPLIARLVNAFSPLALCLASVVVLTGAVAAWLHLGSFSTLFHSAYGAVLLLKLACVVLVLAAGAHNWLKMRAELAHPQTGASAIASFRRSAWSELTFAAMVIAVTAVLVAVQPPLH